MKVIKTGTMPNGTQIQIEDWSMNYTCFSYAATLASYPLSKKTKEGGFSPREGKEYRFSFNFELEQEAKNAFDSLISGEKVLSDFCDKMYDPKYADCI